MVRATKSTFIHFGLIGIGVKIYSTQLKNPISFSNLCPSCKSPISHLNFCKNCNKEIPYNTLLKGYEISKNNIIVLTQEQVKTLKTIEDNGIEIVGFIDENDIPFYEINATYTLLPSNEANKKLFVLFREALKQTNLVAFGRFVMRSVEYLCIIKPFGKRLFLLTLLHPHRIRLCDTIDCEINEKDLNLAIQLIENLKTTFSELHNKGETIDKQYNNFLKLLNGELEIKEIQKQTKATTITEQLEESLKMIKKVDK